MMRILMVFSTKSGASRECAEMLAARIENCTICDLEEKTPDLNSYDVVVAGSGIRRGKAYKPFRSFLKDNTDILLSKKTAFFLCGMTLDKAKENIEKNIPDELRKNAVCLKMFSGKAPFGERTARDPVNMDDIEAFAKAVRGIM